jgi:hypothetical protein
MYERERGYLVPAALPQVTTPSSGVESPHYSVALGVKFQNKLCRKHSNHSRTASPGWLSRSLPCASLSLLCCNKFTK